MCRNAIQNLALVLVLPTATLPALASGDLNNALAGC